MSSEEKKWYWKSFLLWLVIFFPVMTITVSWWLLHVFILIGIVPSQIGMIWSGHKNVVPIALALFISSLIPLLLHGFLHDIGVGHWLPGILGQT